MRNRHKNFFIFSQVAIGRFSIVLPGGFMKNCCRAFTLFLLIGLFPPAAHASPLFTAKALSNEKKIEQTQSGDPVTLPPAYTDRDVESILARMSDDQVRRLLISELRKDAANRDVSAQAKAEESFFSRSFQDMEQSTNRADRELEAFIANIAHIPKHLQQAYRKLSGGAGIGSLARMVMFFAGIFFVGYAVEVLLRKFVRKYREKIADAPLSTGVAKFWDALLLAMLDFLGIAVFALISTLLFLLLFGADEGPPRLLFLAVLVITLVYRSMAVLADLIFSPKTAEFRLLALDEGAAVGLYRIVTGLTGYSVFGVIFCSALRRLNVPKDSVEFIGLVLGTILIVIICYLVWKNRRAVAASILGKGNQGQRENSRLKEHFAGIWHVFALAYLLVVWVIWAGRMVVVEDSARGAFFVSLLIVPIYLIMDRIAQWLIEATIGSIRSDNGKSSGTPAADHRENGLADEIAPEKPFAMAHDDAPESRYLFLARKAVRFFIVLSLAFWLLGLWGVDLPLARRVVDAAFDIIVTLALAHLVWGAVSRFIGRKLAETAPQVEGKGEEEAGEWGGGVALDRNQTLLPMLRKFVGTVLVVMVTLIVLSSIGVDIGPLLAGAGVVGLAIGFGAQKLVSDVLSGLFYLLDDAFRVGEYIQAGSISGVVEQITLRNVKLRHHRGMLQLVPFSDLGSITNFMRGGMVVKFNIQLPYDTDIEKVRKIIKKVGKKMLEDEEIGPDFIQPLKSQGVRSVGDSVMTFRVKFTAKPGKHFLIRREAFRRITKALAQKGIYYAHRKVIVDLPDELKTDHGSGAESGSGENANPNVRLGLQAGAAAAIENLVAQEKAAAPKEDKSSE